MKVDCFAFLLTLLTSSAVVNGLNKGDIILQHNFDGTAEQTIWNLTLGPLIQLVTTDRGNQALRIERKQQNGSSTTVPIQLPAFTLRGCKIRIQALVKAENVTTPPNSWNGIKIMLYTKDSKGENYPQQNLPQGTFNWRMADYTASIPDDVQQARLILGLEAVTGTVWFDDLQIIVYSPPRPRPPTPPTGPPYKGHSLSRLRGAMIGTNLKEQDFRDIGSWNANHIRWQLMWNGFPHTPADTGDIPAYEAWLESALKQLDSMLPVCRQLGLHILVDLHTPPGGRNSENQWPLFHEKRFQDTFLTAWEKIARRYKNESIIWGYDLVNEPTDNTVVDGVRDWRDLAITAVQRIRAIDSEHAIIIEASPGGGLSSLPDLEPLPFNKLVYSFHMYEPGQFTHQNVYNDIPPIAYPGIINGKMWNKDQIRRVMQPVLDWQRDYNVHIYIGEFSAIRWAPGDSARDYLADVIDLFEENGWDWAYHAFREWPGWSVEHTGDKNNTQRATEPTNRQKLLMDWFKKNEH
jgi:endoglucanase